MYHLLCSDPAQAWPHHPPILRGLVAFRKKEITRQLAVRFNSPTTGTSQGYANTRIEQGAATCKVAPARRPQSVPPVAAGGGGAFVG